MIPTNFCNSIFIENNNFLPEYFLCTGRLLKRFRKTKELILYQLKTSLHTSEVKVSWKKIFMLFWDNHENFIALPFLFSSYVALVISNLSMFYAESSWKTKQQTKQTLIDETIVIRGFVNITSIRYSLLRKCSTNYWK